MHHHMEVWLSSNENVENQIEQLLAPFQKEYNDDGFWDWYEIGGRWTGAHGNYDPSRDPNNYHTCEYCRGTGIREDKTCNACHYSTEDHEIIPQHPDGIIGLARNWLNKAHESAVIPAIKTPENLTCGRFIAASEGNILAHLNDNTWKHPIDVLATLKEHKLGDRGFLVTIDYHS